MAKIFHFTSKAKWFITQAKVDIKHKAKWIVLEKEHRYYNLFTSYSNGGVAKVNDFNCKKK